MKSSQRSAPSTTRGLFKAPYRRDGCEVVEIVDRQNRCIANITLVDGISTTLARRVLRELLDAADPPLKLELMR